MKVEDGDTVKVEYTGKLDDGHVFDTSEGKAPLEFKVGTPGIIKGFNKALIGMKLSEEKEFKLQPKDAYGERNAKLMQEVPAEPLRKSQGKEPEAGMLLTLQSKEGHVVNAIVAKVSEDKSKMTLDLNHPLAGKNLNFKVKVVDVKK